MKNALLFVLLWILFAGSSSCKKDPPNLNAKSKIQAVVDKVRSDLSVSLGISYPSVSLIIETPTDKFFVSATGEGSQIVTPDTYYRFASNTKNFTATSVLNMWEDGWLDYKAKITDVIPGSKLTYVPSGERWDFPFKEQITIEQLLQHAAGVYDVDNDTVPGVSDMTYTETIHKSDPTHQFSTGEMVQQLTEKHLFYFAPGTGYHYSNTGYSILAEIIARVYSVNAGKTKTYADYIKDYVTGSGTPVPLLKLHFPVLATDTQLPDPHLTSTILQPWGVEKFDAFNMSAQVGEGNGYGTMEQLHKYIRTLMKGQNVLKPATVNLMQTNVSAANLAYGLGCDYIDNIGYGHNGARLGFLNSMHYDQKHDVSVVVMIPLFDFRNGMTSFAICYNALKTAAYGAREALGYPGKP